MNYLISIFLIVTVCLLPGCGGTLVDFAKETFPQGEEHKDQKNIIKQYMRKTHVYDQFTTLALFDTLWLSDSIKEVYTDMYASMLGKTDHSKKSFLRRQLKENSHFISFYVLSTHEVPLTVNPVLWKIHLEIDGKKQLPFSLKLVEIPAQYQMMFGKNFTKHKQAYHLQFDRKDGNGNDLLSSGHEHDIKIVFSSSSHFSSIKWMVDTEGNLISKKDMMKRKKVDSCMSDDQ